MQVTRPRIATSSASVRTLKRRCAEMQSIRQLVAKGESSALLKNEVDYLTEADRQLLLQEAGIMSSIRASQALAIKAGLEIPWTKLRCLRR